MSDDCVGILCQTHNVGSNIDRVPGLQERNNIIGPRPEDFLTLPAVGLGPLAVGAEETLAHAIVNEKPQ